jgi:hypothetical protein
MRDRINLKFSILFLSILFVAATACAGADEESSQRQRPEDWAERLEQLRAIPYLGYSERAAEGSTAGVVLYDAQKAFDGYNFYCARARGRASLFDMDGREVHAWRYSPTVDDYAILLENGDLLVVVRHAFLLRLNWDSEVIWKHRMAAHHDIVQAPDGGFYTILRESKQHREMRVWFDVVAHLTEDGAVMETWSTYDHLDEIKGALDTRSFWDTLLDSALAEYSAHEDGENKVREKMAQHHELHDYFHVNTVSLIPPNELEQKDSRFQHGNILICFRNVNQIAVLEKDTYRIVWSWGEGALEWPHHPTMLENGHILVFDNGTRRRYSRAVELNPLTEEVVWEYAAEPEEEFFSFFRGSVQRLPNGNTLICESDNGRVFEVTQEGGIVWTWLNPGIRGGHRESLYRVMRLPRAKVENLLERHG